jgi:uncharacterized protein YbjT (DUF2867 family)
VAFRHVTTPILVAGATGDLGGRIVAELLRPYPLQWAGTTGSLSALSNQGAATR